VNVGLLGIKSEKHDEGTKNFGINLADALQTSVDEVLYINIQAGIGLTELKQLRNHDLDLVHLIPGPTFKGLFLLEMVGRYTGARTVATALQPRFSRVSKQVARLFPADLLLVHSSGQLDTMVNVGRELSMVPCGVDTDRFLPVDTTEKRQLRAKYDIPVDDTVFLHVGHFKEGRNLRSLKPFAERGTVIVIGSPSTAQEEGIKREMENSDCIVIDSYIENIEEYYQLADCYVFPTEDEQHCIQVPLSVLEAMACNCAVVSTKFGGLPDMFSESEGFKFVEGELSSGVDISTENVRTRDMVVKYSWSELANTVSNLYMEL
jgi:glycosyltransferase involved in cell wall biosynthesis